MPKNEVTVVGDGLEEFAMPDINLPGLIELKDSVLNVDGIPDRAAIILSLSAMGFGPVRIGEMVGISKSGVRDYLARYDPKGLCVIGKEDRRALTTKMLQSTAVEALMSITHEKLKESPAKELANIATKCVAAVEKLNLSKEMGGAIRASRVDSMLDALDVIDVGEG